MTLDEPAQTSPESDRDDANWRAAIDVLTELLQRARDGSVSAQTVRKELEARGIPEARQLVARLRAVDFESPDAPTCSSHWYHFGRSFLVEEKYREVQRSQAAEAAHVEALEAVAEEAADETEAESEALPPRERKKRRAEEARMGTYIVPVLEELYDTQYAPDTYVFDVHSERAGGDFENVDLLAVHWRSEKTVDLVTVEVKQRFSPLLVQQARNYTRFSDRVWIAMPVEATDAKDAAAELRANDLLLFDHVVEIGLGVLACHQRRGRAYDVFPVQWPRRNAVDALERERLVERYRSQFEQAGVVPARAKSYPRFP